MKSINSQEVSQRFAGYNSYSVTIPRLTGELNKERTVDIRQIYSNKLEQSGCQLYTNLPRLFYLSGRRLNIFMATKGSILNLQPLP